MKRPASVTALGILLLPPGILAVIIGGYVVYAALSNAAYLHR